ncbi:WYL domain-containing protein [Alteromonas sp. ASW11-130]|uniref:WYL domain-containing protein n=1 Tax=Alteromonas sp. ASW11-130 TaxID=3015775 RepID=UPI0022424280|nr:WYL domain-containing protein [Alteromonas sp. ASW11-130]MCW8091448.1 WYL domain-containing protein [Alteromonas sp. ASW11-130]
MSTNDKLQDLSHAQRERLAFIDFSLQYFGAICRQDLINQFATGLAASTRDFTLYRQLAPQNLILDHQTKRYLRCEAFDPLFPHDPDVILTSLSRGFGDGLSSHFRASEQCLHAIQLIHPDAAIIGQLMRAVIHRYPIEANYVSVSSGTKTRIIVPHAVVNNGHRWHVRAFDCTHGMFRDFVCTRFKSIGTIKRDIAEKESVLKDAGWQQLVSLELIPHPEIATPEAIYMDYNMKNGKKVVTIRAALAAYLLRYWQVDCSVKHRIRGQGCQLALANLDVLQQIENAQLAPGAVNTRN